MEPDDFGEKEGAEAMSMTKEEAIERFEKQLTAAQAVLDSGFGTNLGESDLLYRRRKEMAEIALSALRPITREQVEKVWRGGVDVSDFCRSEGRKRPSLPVLRMWEYRNSACKASILPILRRPHDGRGRGHGDGEAGGAA